MPDSSITEPPAIYMIGNAHLDPAWMWQLAEGFEAFLATCRSALERMKETPGFIFTASSAAHYEFVEKTDPALFSRIQEEVKAGKWSLVGGWWVESDCNLPGGETFIRQALYGQKYFQSRFGMQCTTGYCIDSFGHNANLPQLLRHCGMTRYIFMRPDEHEKYLPNALFKWQAPSGDEVITYRLPLHYSNHKHSVNEKIKLLESYPLYTNNHPWMLFYGVGNHGGGPTKEQIAQIISVQSSRNNIFFASSDQFFDRVDQDALPAIKDEMQPHAVGCYSAHSEIKKLHRLSENRLLRSEKICIMVESNFKTYQADWQKFDQAWRNILLNSFHDILGGVSIKETCDAAIALYNESLAIASREERNAVQILSNNIDTSDAIESLLIFNPHSLIVSTPIEFELWHPDASENGIELKTISLKDEIGDALPNQRIESSGKIGGDRVRFAAQVELQAFGWKRLMIERNSAEPKTKSSLICNAKKLSNGICGIVFDGEGGKNEISYSPAQVYTDTSDTWGHGIAGFNDKKGLFKIEKIMVIEKGPVRGRIRIESSYGNSRMEEDFILYEGSDHIEQRIYLDWRKTNAVLKLRYAHGYKDPKVIYEIPYSVLERSVTSDEVCGGAWAFVQDDSKGLGIINDAKYSYSSDEKYFYITCARSPLYSHHSPPHTLSENETKRYLDQGEQEFTVRIIPGKKNWREAEMSRRSLEFLQPPIVHIESSHAGAIKKSESEIEVSAKNILITVMKHSYDDDKIVIRALETLGNPTDCSFQFSVPHARWAAKFQPYELKSFLIEDSKIIEINGLEELQKNEYF